MFARITKYPVISKTLSSQASLKTSYYLNTKMVHTVTSAQEFKTAIAEGLVIVDFFATWCGPCKMVAPLLDKLEPQFSHIKFLKVDIEEVPEIASQYQVSAVPTFLFLKDGKEVNVVRGAAPAKIKEALEQLK